MPLFKKPKEPEKPINPKVEVSSQDTTTFTAIAVYCPHCNEKIEVYVKNEKVVV